MNGGRLALLALAAMAGLAAAAWLWLRTRRALRERLRWMAITGSRRLKYRLDRYKLVERDRIREALMHDPAILQAIAVHAREHATPEAAVRVRVNEYIDEIVPFFNVLSYYKLGYNLPPAAQPALQGRRSSTRTTRPWSGFRGATWWCT